ncbi:MAG: Ribosome maturation factor RimM [Myxococcota bacterium]|nr:Ribosome maturation factor RimM [Myxococcota bacterium]
MKLPVGIVARPHGVRGALLIRTFSGALDGLRSAPVLTLRGPVESRDFEVLEINPLPDGGAKATLKGIPDRNAAEGFRGWRVEADTEYLPEPAGDEFYYHEAEGLPVQLEDGTAAGVIEMLYDNGAQDVLVIRSPGGVRYEVPLVDELVPCFDVKERRVVIRPIEGLLPHPL